MWPFASCSSFTGIPNTMFALNSVLIYAHTILVNIRLLLQMCIYLQSNDTRLYTMQASSKLVNGWV